MTPVDLLCSERGKRSADGRSLGLGLNGPGGSAATRTVQVAQAP
jgi:hypothetical protein